MPWKNGIGFWRKDGTYKSKYDTGKLQKLQKGENDDFVLIHVFFIIFVISQKEPTQRQLKLVGNRRHKTESTQTNLTLAHMEKLQCESLISGNIENRSEVHGNKRKQNPSGSKNSEATSGSVQTEAKLSQGVENSLHTRANEFCNAYTWSPVRPSIKSIIQGHQLIECGTG